MFIVLLKFAENKSSAKDWMDGHNAWLKRGFDDGVFLLAGSLQPGLGGGILAHGLSKSELEERVDDDPFIKARVVEAQIIEMTPSKADQRLAFLVG
ncbi:YciI family protein [Trinickia diaoshuihuensis]|jgi:uncharacterized protein YciI|uniref:YciI family protein n=1 Tax=Trinickia diaoshuihuensis TaxID=2292265 RepID=UPI000E228AE6|nr:hypothetical protein [Trinickia diaoshuihuensis]